MLGLTDEQDDQIRVLYVNTDSAFAELVQTKLQQTATEIHCLPADGIDEAVRSLATERIDCVVTAYSLEDSDGIELTRAIRQQNDDVPIILFTGQGSEEIASEATRAGVSDYIPARSERDNFTLLAARIQTLTTAARKRSEAEQTQRRFRRTLERATDAIYAVDSDWRIEYMNEKMAERVDRNPDAVVGETLWDEFPSIVGTELEERYRSAMESGEPVSFDHRLGDPFDYRVEVRAYPDDDGLTVFSREISAGREAARREHRELAEEYEALLETSGDAIFLVDVDTAGPEPSFEFARLSPGYETETGITTEDVRGKTPREVFGDERGADLEANYTRCVEASAPISYREELDIADQARFWETSLAPVVVDGETVRIVGISRNVTEQVERERDLETTNQRLESLIEATPLTVMEIDRDGTVVRWNDEAENMFGWSREEVLGEFNPMVPDERRSEFESHRRRALSGERIRAEEIRRETKSGDELDLLLSVAPITGPDGETRTILAVLEDITEQKQLEARLRSLQETAQELSAAESSDEIGSIAVDAAAEILGLDITGIWEYDEQGDALVPITETPGARELFGDSPRLTPGDSLAWDAFESGETQVYDDVRTEGQPQNPDTEIRSEILVPLGDQGLMSTGSVSTQVFSETDVDLFRILGATVEAALARASREAELHRQNERLDQFASVVAHDLRNPLSVAKGFLEIAEETGDPDHFEKVASSHDRIERLIEDLLTLARGETTIEDTEVVDLESITTEAWGYVDTEEATLTVADDAPTVTGDAGRLTQLFENLFRNAVEHGGADVTVTVGRLAEDDGFYVEDTGSGIPQERRDEVFKHGVTSSEGGTGFGLSIVADIAKAHGWTVSVTDGTDGGARFEFRRSK